MKIRDKIGKSLGFYLDKEAPFSVEFRRIGKSGMFDKKAAMELIAVICDYLEEKEKEK